ncbi:MAG: hypothetical protein V4572_07150 [Bacteroidota bacterium]
MNELEKLKKEMLEEINKMEKVFLNPSFESIFEIIDATEIKINIPKHDISNHDATLEKNLEGELIIKIKNILSNMTESYDVEVLIGNKTYLIEELNISMSSTVLEKKGNDEFLSGEISYWGKIHSLNYKTKYEENSFCRFIIPIDSSQLDYYIETKSFSDENSLNAFGKVSLELKDGEFDLYQKKVRDKNYFIIDSCKKMDGNIFADICHSILISYSFLSADFHQNEAYYLKSDTYEFLNIVETSYLKLRKSILSKGTCNPIYSNPYGYTKDEEIIKKVGKQLTRFDSKLFSKLCDKVFNESDYAILILLIIESNVSSLILRPVGYSVALEKITNIITEENSGLKPIPDKVLSKSFIQKIKSVLTEFTEQINAVGNKDSIRIIEKNIDRLNSPTNRDKLTKPFGIYGINLSDSELSVINDRNSFLHGRSIKAEDENSEFLKIYMITLCLNKLVNKLILKHIGYSGYIINHLKSNERSFESEIEGEIFELI